MGKTHFRNRPQCYPAGGKRQTMTRCEICSRPRMAGNNVSHSKRHTKRRWSTNTHRATIEIDGERTQVKICTRCLRSHYKVAVKA